MDSSLTSEKDGGFPLTTDMCTEQRLLDLTPRVMVNILKFNKENKEFEKYSNAVVFDIFPRLGTSLFEVGPVVGDTDTDWDSVSHQPV